MVNASSRTAGLRRRGVGRRLLVAAGWLVLAASLLTGCGQDDPVEVQPPPRAEEVARLEQELRLLKREHQADLATQAARIERAFRGQQATEQEALLQRVARAETTAKELQDRLAERDRQIESLRQEMARADPPPDEAPAAARVSVFRAPPLPTQSVGGEGFPLKIYDVAARRAVSGKHTNIRFVTLDDTRGSGGDSAGARIPEAYEVEEYTYEVVFSVENLADEPQSFTMRAGGASRTVHLDAGETRTNVAVAAMMGAPLIVTKDAYRRRFVVPAPQATDAGQDR